MRPLFNVQGKSFWISWITILLANSCLMTVEIAASRLLAPYIGVSLLAWAGVIGVVFVAMALGYGLGGYVADRVSSVRVVSGALLAAGASVALMPFLSRYVGSFLVSTNLSLATDAFLVSASTLFVPSVFLAAIHPYLAKRITPDLERAGRSIGLLNAAAAVGSILGTFATGFIWLMWVSVPIILGIMACCLGVLGVGIYGCANTIKGGTELPLQKASKKSLTDRKKTVYYFLLACLTGFVLMSLEVVAGRALAPYIGVSVFTWTGVIGVILVGIIGGNMIGGLLADRESSRALLGKAFVGSGIAILVALYVVMVTGPLFASVTLPLVLRTILFTLLAFLPPSLALATITPQLVKLAAKEWQIFGSQAGSLAAWNTLGGLLGTLSTGFFLISWIGTRGLLVVLALMCLVVGMLLSKPKLPLRPRALFVVGICFLLVGIAPASCLKETQYYCIQLLKDAAFSDQDPAYVMRLDHLVHSYVHLRQPETLGYGYEQVYAHLIATLHSQADSISSLFIGGGGYVLPRYLAVRYPQARSVVSEIDPGVTEVNKTDLALPTTASIETKNLDARMYLLRTSSEKPFDFVFGDAFNDFSVPYHLTTLEFHELLKSRMSQDGVYALNIIDDARYGNFLTAMVKTLKVVWKNVYVAPGAAEFAKGRNTIVLIATDRVLDEVAWKTVISPAAQAGKIEENEYRRLTQLLPSPAVEAFLRGHPVPPLTDAFVPTDRYLAPVFADAY